MEYYKTKDIEEIMLKYIDKYFSKTQFTEVNKVLQDIDDDIVDLEIFNHEENS